MVLGNREKWHLVKHRRYLRKVVYPDSDYHEFSAVILVDTNGSEVKLIKQSVTKVCSEKAKEIL